jgi:hypothetical protein
MKVKNQTNNPISYNPNGRVFIILHPEAVNEVPKDMERGLSAMACALRGTKALQVILTKEEAEKFSCKMGLDRCECLENNIFVFDSIIKNEKHEEHTKRKRGRPRKKPVENNLPKRKRGRPRKNEQ